MGTCLSSARPETSPGRRHDGPEKSQIGFPVGLENVLRDVDLQRSSRGKSKQNRYSSSRETRVKDPKDLQTGSGQPTVRKTVQRKLCPNPSSQKSLYRKVSVPSIRTPVDGRLPSTAPTRKTIDRRAGSTASARKPLVSHQLEDRKLAEALGIHTGREDLVDSTKAKASGWRSFELLLSERLREADADGRKKMSRYSPAWPSSPNVDGDDRPRDRGHPRMSPGFRGVQVGRQPVDRRRAERKSMERRSEERKPVEGISEARKPAERKSKEGKLVESNSEERNSMERRSEERKPVERKSEARKPGEIKSEGGNSIEANSVERSQSMERRRVSQRKPVERKSEGGNSIETNTVERSQSMERRRVSQRKPVERKSEGGNSIETNTVERSQSMERRRGGNSIETNTVERSQSMERRRASPRKPGERKSLDRKSGDKKFGETVKPATPERKSFDRKSVNRPQSVERVRAPAENSGSPPTSLNHNRRSLDRATHFLPDHSSKTIRKPRTRNGYFTPETGNSKLLPDGRHRRPSVDPRFRTSFTDLDFLNQKFLVDYSEQAIQARIDSSFSSAPGQASQLDQTDPSYSSSDYRSAHHIDDFTKSCRESAARAAARDLDSFKNLTSIDSSDSSGTMLRSR